MLFTPSRRKSSKTPAYGLISLVRLIGAPVAGFPISEPPGLFLLSIIFVSFILVVCF